MKHLTFIQYLTELTVSDDPTQAMADVKQAARDPERYRKKQLAQGIDDQRAIKQTDDPNKSEKLRIEKLKQQLIRAKQNLSLKEK